jgi:hypothetical protein
LIRLYLVQPAVNALWALSEKYLIRLFRTDLRLSLCAVHWQGAFPF